MPDSDSPEIPQGRPEKKSIKDKLREIRDSAAASNRKRESIDVDGFTQNLTPENRQEVFFRESAKRLAKEEAEIVGLMDVYLQSFPPDITEDILVSEVSPNFPSLRLRTDKIKREEFSDRKVSINFKNHRNGSSDNSELVGVDTANRLEIPVYTDRETRNKFLEYAQNEVKKGYAEGHLDSIYFFNEKGDYGKIIKVNSDFNSGKPRLWDTEKLAREHGGIGSTAFISEMTPEDFELAGRALGLIKRELKQRLGIKDDEEESEADLPNSDQPNPQ